MLRAGLKAGRYVRFLRMRVLFLCTGNSARSQMAEGLWRWESGGSWEVFSAGTEPGAVREDAIQAMREIGMEAARLLFRRLNEPGMALTRQRIVLEPTLVVRESSGAPKAR